MMPRSVLLSKMDGEERRCNASWVFAVIAMNCGAAPRLGAKKGIEARYCKNFIFFAIVEGFVVLPSFPFREAFRDVTGGSDVFFWV